MADTAPTVESRVLGVLLPVLGIAPGDPGIGPDTDLWASGLDSLRGVSLMVGLEDEFAIEFPDEMLRRDTFTTVRSISEAVLAITG
ncbi:phosphopantetheine-binding protein [Streptomyces sp. NPDC092296]|uniref:phosphopantetheine-binding protein n=1 Tax=Streptomyces sp. NPDC092296 TaxID=3366012 RepID=UPI0037FB6CE8